MENKDEIVLYKTKSGDVELGVRFENNTVWLTRETNVRSFQKEKGTISEHISNYLRKVNWLKNQLFGNSEQLRLMEKFMIQFYIILML